MSSYLKSPRAQIIFGLLVLLLGTSIAYAVLAWQNPTQNPPNGNLPAPLDTSASTQTKIGSLNVLGNVGIGTATPQGHLDMNGNTIVRVGTPINATDAANKAYVDAASTPSTPSNWTCTVRSGSAYNSTPHATVSCSGSEKVISGGCVSGETTQGESASAPFGQGWQCTGVDSSSFYTMTVYANCCQ